MASPFSGKAGRNASIWTAGLLDDRQGQINDLINLGQTNSLNAIDRGQKKSLAALGSGYKTARAQYQPYADTGLKAFNQYADATGVNGQEGYDRSVGLYRQSPGYQNAVNEATDSVARQQSALGALGSGNTMTAISDRAKDMADRDYGQYLDRLNGIGQVGYNASGNIANLATNYGNSKAGLYSDTSKSRANIYSDATRLGVGARADTARQIADVGYKGMMAGQEAAATRMNFGLQALGTGLSFLGMPTGGGSTIGGSLFNKLM